MTDVRTALYRFYDVAGILLYIGITDDLAARWKRHSETKPWWPHVQRQTAEWYGCRDDALLAEELAIKAEHPVYNVHHNDALRVFVALGFEQAASREARRQAAVRVPTITDADVLVLSDFRKSCLSGDVQAIRERAHLTQAEVASAVGVARQTIHLWETGQRIPGGGRALEYAKVLEQLAAMISNWESAA